MSALNDKDIAAAAKALQPIFALNGWTWRGEELSPTAYEIELHIHDLVNAARHDVRGGRLNGHERVSGGRIAVYRHNRDDMDRYYEDIHLEMGVITSGHSDESRRVQV